MSERQISTAELDEIYAYILSRGAASIRLLISSGGMDVASYNEGVWFSSKGIMRAWYSIVNIYTGPNAAIGWERELAGKSKDQTMWDASRNAEMDWKLASFLKRLVETRIKKLSATRTVDGVIVIDAESRQITASLTYTVKTEQKDIDWSAGPL